MATLPSPRTWASGDNPTATQLNTDIRDGFSFLLNPPRVLVYRSAGQTSSGSETLLTWDREIFDSDGLHSTSSNTSRLTVVTAGVYEVVLHIDWAVTVDASPGNRFATVQKNNAGGTTPGSATEIGSDYITGALSNASNPEVNHLVFQHLFSAGDYIEALARCTDAGGRSTVSAGGSEHLTYFGMFWMGTS